MGTNLAKVQNETRLAKPASEFSSEQIRILAETVAKGCYQNELAFFLQVAKLKRLDPFTGQIHVVKRWDSQAGKDKINCGPPIVRITRAIWGPTSSTSTRRVSMLA